MLRVSYKNRPCLLVLVLVQEVAASLNLVLLTNRTLLTRAAATAAPGLGLETYLCVVIHI